ncbi:MAG TPA: Hsp20/alpha crystallin family protein [Bacteroidota bacterium]|nr:Hsp20/alpha crystallin family protein [Candidatus Kapabacteria bacterium]HRS02671.1 Hsp20/alpha crystallin family protein [Bacteroidota bacterium]
MEKIRIDFDKELNEIPRYFDEVKNIVNSTISGIATGIENLSIRSDINETKDAVEITVELPGVKKENLHLYVDDERKLILEGEKKRPNTIESNSRLRVESKSGKFRRVFPLSDKLDETKINAKYEDGLLTINIPKKEQEKKTIDIVIN